MGLLQTDESQEFQKLTFEIYSRQLEADSRLKGELDERARQKMYQDVRYNVDFLSTALALDDTDIFERYARWLYQLLCPLMTYCTRERLRDIMLSHYELIRICMKETMPVHMHEKLNCLLDTAVQATIEESIENADAGYKSGKYEEHVTQYLELLLKSDSEGAMNLIALYVKNEIPIADICVDIIAESMRRVGDLWHRNLISVDMEHYCTSVSQMALSQLYPIIFDRDRKQKSVLVACVGSELHEAGPRMVADLFEYAGWDSIYLGAAVSNETILASVTEHRPDLVALSVTMPQHLLLCRDTVTMLRSQWPEIKIAVGGNAFEHTNVWEKWAVKYTKDARELVEWADKTL